MSAPTIQAGDWSVTRDDVLIDFPLIDELLEPHRDSLDIGYWGYRAHCYRMVNWARFVTARAVPGGEARHHGGLARPSVLPDGEPGLPRPGDERGIQGRGHIQHREVRTSAPAPSAADDALVTLTSLPRRPYDHLDRATTRSAMSLQPC